MQTCIEMLSLIECENYEISMPYPSMREPLEYCTVGICENTEKMGLLEEPYHRAKNLHLVSAAVHHHVYVKRPDGI
jgi:hypothetical protein